MPAGINVATAGRTYLATELGLTESRKNMLFSGKTLFSVCPGANQAIMTGRSI
jgi:hypothetical protein